ncbi:MAG: TolC family protein [Bacteroidia bacterium]|nr:TolC family protein [Bacteroidia bacterium]
MRKLIILILLVTGGILKAQNSTSITWTEFLDQVLASHPLALQAGLKAEEGNALVQMARGNFDPQLKGDFSQKTFAGKSYYRKLETGIEVPTWMGVTVQAGYSQGNGDFINPEMYTPDAGLLKAGLEVNLGNGLLMDKRRVELAKAKIYREVTQAQQQIMLNDLVVEAGKSYWNWVQHWFENEIYEQAVKLAKVRFDGVKSSFLQGDKPAIDTTEALIQVQNRAYLLNESRMKLNEARLELSRFLWDEEGNPLELRPEISPPKLPNLLPVSPPDFNTGNLRADSILPYHPALQYYRLMQSSLQIEKRYRAEQLKPKASLKYNFLAGAAAPLNYELGDNHQLGFKLEFPLFLRSERGNLQLTRLKIRQTELETRQKEWEITTKLGQLENKIRITAEQITLNAKVVENYQKLVEGEYQRFLSGESSLFMINAREQNQFKAQMILLEELTDYRVLLAEYYRTTGGLSSLED